MCTQPTSTRCAPRRITAAGWVWIAACRRSWSPPPVTARRSPVSATPPKHCARGWLASGACRNRCRASRKDQLTAARPPTGAAPSPQHQRASAFPAPGFQRAGQDPRPARDRRPQRDRDAAQPPASPSDLRCRLGRVRPPPTVQAGLAWRRRLSGRPLVPVEQALPRMRDCSRRSEPGRARIHLWLWAFCRPRSQRGHQSSPLGPGPSRPSPIPGPPSRRPGHQRPPTGRR